MKYLKKPKFKFQYNFELMKKRIMDALKASNITIPKISKEQIDN
jgi:hypothetical protein